MIALFPHTETRKKDEYGNKSFYGRKFNFVTDTVTFYLDEEIPKLGTDLLHVGSLLGQMGANSMTDGIYSQHGRILKSINKFVFDQTTCTAFLASIVTEKKTAI